MKITLLDAATLGDDIKDTIFEVFGRFGQVDMRDSTTPGEVENATLESDIVVINKVKLGENLAKAEKLKLICIAATGYDNVDIDWCRKHNVAVCNVKGYSTQSVAQLTIAMALTLVNHMREYCDYVNCGDYTKSGVANRLVPVYHEISGKKWGIIGVGNIGLEVAKVAEALGCEVFVNKRNNDTRYPLLDIDTLCKTCDIISIHTPLTAETRNIINRERISLMKKEALFINVARGAVADEEALAEAIETGKIGGIGIDVYSKEPMDKEHPFNRILGRPNVCLTPHNAWGSYEARVRCIKIMGENIESFLIGGSENRVDI